LLALRLSPFGIHPHNIQVNGRQSKGYDLTDFTAAFSASSLTVPHNLNPNLNPNRNLNFNLNRPDLGYRLSAIFYLLSVASPLLLFDKS